MIVHRFDARRVMAALCCVTLGLPWLAQAQSVAMTGGMGSKALLVINGGAPKALSAGQIHLGVKVISVGAEQVVVEVGGKRQTVALGGAPVSLAGASGGGGGGDKLVLPGGEGGHFRVAAIINGKTVDGVIDTGATFVSMSIAEAQRLGIDYLKGQKGMSSTANGVVPTYLVRLRSVRIRDVEVFDVQASVTTGQLPVVLLGNSFLSRFKMVRDSDQLTLTRRY
jgi:aspartyl protease family protein